MKTWKRMSVCLISAMAIYSCAGHSPALKPGEQSRERSLPSTTLQERPTVRSGRSDAGPSPAAPSAAPGSASQPPDTAQSASGGGTERLGPAPSAVEPRAAGSKGYTDYRSKALRTRIIQPIPAESLPGENQEDYVSLNFDNADIKEVIATIAKLVDLKYIVDPQIQGDVTINTVGSFAKENLLSVLYLILEANGLTAVKEGAFYRITTMEGASRLPVLLRLQEEGAPAVRREEIVIQIIPLDSISAAEMSQLLKPFLSASATIISHEATNTLLLVDKGMNIMKALKMVEAFDISFFEQINYHFFFLENIDAADAVQILREVFSPAAGARKDGVKFIPIQRLNALLALSADKRTFSRIQQLLSNLDAPTENIEPRIYIYFVKNGSALDLANILDQVFAGAIATGDGKDPQPAFPRSRKAALARQPAREPGAGPGLRLQAEAAAVPTAPPPETPAPVAAPDKESATGRSILKGVVKITPDEVRNAIIVQASPADYRAIMDVLETIDVLPRQVLIEATIAEIDYSIVTDLGVTWEYLKGASFGTGLLNLRSSGDSGLTFAVGVSDELRMTLDALERENKVNILSSPHVLASDNQVARIDISQEIPTVTAETVVPTSGEAIVTTTVQYRDTGVRLAVTPHINERGLVTMDIYQEVSEQAEDVDVAGESFPSFFKRVVETSLTVQHGQTIVLGGLIRENKSDGSSGIPWLARLPVIGFVFGATRNSFDKTELIVLLTPIVMVDLDDVDAVTRGFKSKVDSVVRDMYEKRTVQ